MPECFKKVGIRLVREKSYYNKITCTQDAIDLFADEIRMFDREVFGVICMDGSGCPVNFCITSIGSIDRTFASGRDIFKPVILSNATSIIIMHNHPSGDSSPSNNDIVITNNIKDCCKLLGYELLDHIIVGDTNYSFKKEGLI